MTQEEEFGLDFELDEIEIEVDIPSQEKPDEGLPKVYLQLDNLVMLQQVKGLVEDDADLVTVEGYAYKGETLQRVGTIELTSVNVLAMQRLGLKVTLVRQSKENINFDKPEDFMAIIKTLKERDTVDFDDSDILEYNAELDEGLLSIYNEQEEGQEAQEEW